MQMVSLTEEAVARLEAWKSTPQEPLSEVILRKIESPAPPDAASPSSILGCATGTMTFHPGWDQPEPPEIWNALNDDLPL